MDENVETAENEAKDAPLAASESRDGTITLKGTFATAEALSYAWTAAVFELLTIMASISPDPLSLTSRGGQLE
jgi:hypothetical protein